MSITIALWINAVMASTALFIGSLMMLPKKGSGVL